jgi:hypothetical protein
MDLYGNTLDRAGRTAEAETYLRQLEERYDYPAPLTGFLGRHLGDADRKAAFEKRTASIFPHGFEAARREDLSTGQPAGVTIKRGKPGVLPSTGDVILAVDGIRVATWDQYCVQSRMSLHSTVALVYRHLGQVDEVSVPRLTLDEYQY